MKTPSQFNFCTYLYLESSTFYLVYEIVSIWYMRDWVVLETKYWIQKSRHNSIDYTAFHRTKQLVIPEVIAAAAYWAEWAGE